MKKEDRKLFSHRFHEESIFVHTTDEDLNPWDRTRIVAVLVNETGIDYQLADKISEEIQATVFSSGIRVVTSELVRELVNAKLIEYRFEKARERNKRLGLSLHDVDGLLRFSAVPRPGPVPSPAGTGAVISDVLKRQFALSEIYPAHLHRMHLEGRFHIHGLSTPDRPWKVYLNALDLLQFSYAGEGLILEKPTGISRFLINVKRLNALLSGFVGYGVHWTGLEDALLKLGAAEEELPHLCAELVQAVLLSGPGVYNGAFRGFHFLRPDVIHAVTLRMAEEKLLNAFITTDGENWFPSPFLVLNNRVPKETTYVLEAISLNLPGLAIRSILEDTTPEAELKHLMTKVLAVFARKRLFLEKVSAVRPGGPLDLLNHLGFNPTLASSVVAVCGLNEWTRVLLDGDMDEGPDRFTGADAFLSGIRNRISEESKRGKIKLLLGTADQGEAAYRFARLDLKFQPFYASRVLNGEIRDGAVYYTHDAALPSDKPLDIKKKVEIEGTFQRKFDLPFRTIIKTRDPEQMPLSHFTKTLRHLLLTQDFSICYNCFTMESGVYQTCPKCHSTEVSTYSSGDGGYECELGQTKTKGMENIRFFFY
ncbi:MAG: hypothetical protein GXO69_03465 [Acidobacteria bacterium]|nr:hypothetical protein [Acidobacteriota bacterium]